MTEECYVYPVLPGTDWREHTDDHPFCGDDDCPCHKDEANLQQLNGWYENGLISNDDRIRIYNGMSL